MVSQQRLCPTLQLGMGDSRRQGWQGRLGALPGLIELATLNDALDQCRDAANVGCPCANSANKPSRGHRHITATMALLQTPQTSRAARPDAEFRDGCWVGLDDNPAAAFSSASCLSFLYNTQSYNGGLNTPIALSSLIFCPQTSAAGKNTAAILRHNLRYSANIGPTTTEQVITALDFLQRHIELRTLIRRLCQPKPAPLSRRGL